MHFQNVYVKLNHAMRSRGVVALGHGRRGQGGRNQVPTTLSQGAAAVIHSRRGKGGRGRGGATASAATLDHEHDVQRKKAIHRATRVISSSQIQKKNNGNEGKYP